jgi:hypothetical protein
MKKGKKRKKVQECTDSFLAVDQPLAYNYQPPFSISLSDLLDFFLFTANCTSVDPRAPRIFVSPDSRFVQKIIHHVRALLTLPGLVTNRPNGDDYEMSHHVFTKKRYSHLKDAHG